MTRPTIIRADTLDLQQHDAPSAQHHYRIHDDLPGSSADPIAPHQAETLREVAHETAEEETRSPGVSWTSGKGSRPGDGHHGQGIDSNIHHSNGVESRSTPAGMTSSDMYNHDQHEQDILAGARHGDNSSSEDGDPEGDGDGDLDDDMMDKISSSPSIEDEDIDFDFVYALHTFVATVEGQANATKGDTMVLLDDSNSYWWLVRVVKDSSIGYLPAEHIETPTERLARLNKHRNIDLSAAMLGDQAQKPKNSFKGIRRRRKTVTFTEPTYVDYSDFDYSTEDDEVDELFSPTLKQAGTQQKQETSANDAVSDEGAKVEPLKTRPAREDNAADSTVQDSAEPRQAGDHDETTDIRHDGVSRSRNGTVRNTDSFFKDESLETKKITLTPNLLRDDSGSRDSTDSTARDSKSSMDKMEKIDRELVSDKDKKKNKDKDKKEKDKKPSAIRSFFSRKDKKKSSDDDDDSFGKRSMDTNSESRDSEDRMMEEQASPEKLNGPQRSTSKLQKQITASKSAGNGPQKSVELASYLAESRTNDVSNVPPASMRIVDPDTRETQEVPSNQQPQKQVQASPERAVSLAAPTRDDLNAASSRSLPPRSSSAGLDAQAIKSSLANTDVDLDESDYTDQEEPPRPEPQRNPHQISQPQAREFGSADSTSSLGRGDAQNSSRALAAASQSEITTPPLQLRQNAVSMERGHEPAANESPAHGSNPPALVVDTSSPEGNSPEASPSPDQSHPAGDGHRTGSSSSKDPGWDDIKLRAFFDDTDHIRDLLAVVYDKNDVEPASNDHPVVASLFREQNAKLAEITTQLDNMLGDWLARKQRLRGTI
ncbi:hypothetical protein HIM_04327 [Hirsutella minnesotensis 3608]|uniref:SH3 domain-containing protein n=1 Tax=Hirsutella minnesotensis 3608 TaxID=1043627 RepID=A0A0F7ZPX2_9HYPO|nr:hypothetical protein HIM_04327 [Hirsutella minnesotensis 3608]